MRLIYILYSFLPVYFTCLPIYLLPAYLFIYFLPMQLSVVSYLYCLLLYYFTTCTDLLQLLGVWYSPSQLLFTCLPVFQLCALTLSFVLSHLTCGGRSGGVARAWWEDRSLALWDSSCCVGVLTLSCGTASQFCFPIASCVGLCLWPGCGLVLYI